MYYNGADGSIWKVPAGGGSPALIAKKAGWPFFESFDGKFIYCSGPEPGIWKVPAEGGRAVVALSTGKRAVWTVSATGIYVLDPDAAGGPTIEFSPFGNRRSEVVRLPGSPEIYAVTVVSLALSPDERWITFMRLDRSETQIMLAENFR